MGLYGQLAAFVAGANVISHRKSSAAPRGLQQPPYSVRTTSQSVGPVALAPGVTALVLLVAAARRASARARGLRLQVRAGRSGLVVTSPVVAYTRALVEVALKLQEAVPVTKDVMRIKRLFLNDSFLEELTLVVNEVGHSELDKARGMVQLLRPLESTVTEKFVTFLAKKRRLLALRLICREYMTSVYDSNSIAPVSVRSAQRLTLAQSDQIIEKMKARTGARDIRLVAEVDPSLLGGFVIEWGFMDPEALEIPTEGIDLSLRTFLRKAALNEGVVVNV